MSTSPTEPPGGRARRDELARGLATVRARIAAACAICDRDPATVTLVVVTKTHPAEDVRLLAGLGVQDVGESREQELTTKHHELADVTVERDGDHLRWHFIGRLQSNKARRVARAADLVHSVDRSALLAPLGDGARLAGRELGCLIQVSLDGDPTRGGVPAAELMALAGELAGTQSLRLRGLMAVAPMGVPPERAFAVLAPMSERLRGEHPGADVVSAGMSGDLEAAVAAGATHLRVGSAVLGARVPLG